MTVAVGTMHGKAAAFAPAFARWLDAEVRPSVDLDTDALGTFTRDVARVISPEDAAIAKARAASSELGTPLGLATEASYSPAFGGFGPMIHEELAVFVDLERCVQVRQKLRTYAAVTPARTVSDETDARKYLSQIGFPNQAVVAWAGGDLHKGIQDEATVLALLRSGPVNLEPDLRAHRNPIRRRTLRRLAWILAARLLTPCRACGCPGFGLVDVERGVPCATCGEETASVRADVFGCAACDERVLRDRGMQVADPATCDACNP
ncbi:hypothetical protein Q9S71_15060 [Microbacterium sp. KSW4-11]|uniref:DUF6671 domain-containing protein n=1 Tax=Microbacterium gawkjiense TaxID=3067309 RepID=A0ABU3GEB2_9MICO|nr:DUF6671 family protein [Microbacterium sp. KSW4-11]MDT3318145.1 hypothetical protein [Microbacterium sp. KSW4-11]